MADAKEAIHAIATYFDVKCGKVTYDGVEEIPVTKGKTGTRRGFVTIVKHLARAADQQQLLGLNAEEKVVVDQWLEYKVCQLDRCAAEKDMETMLKDINSYLADKVYFWNHQLSLIDLALYYTLHSTVRDLTYYQKQKYIHLSRWFNNIQQTKTIRQTYTPVNFSTRKLYSGSAH